MTLCYHKRSGRTQRYGFISDVTEADKVAEHNPEQVARMEAFMAEACRSHPYRQSRRDAPKWSTR